MKENIVSIVLYRSLFYGAIPLSFTLVSTYIVLRRYRSLIPVVVVLALYQATCYIVLHGNPPDIPQRSDLELLAIALPISVALAGCIWSLVVTEALRERLYGIGIAVLGCVLTSIQVAFYVMAIWQNI